MKKVIFTLVFMVVASFASNAQVASSNSSFEFRGGKFYQDGTVIAPEQLSSIFGADAYNNQYLPAKKKRSAGVVCLSAGSAVAAIGAGVLIYGIASGTSESGSAFGGMVAVGAGGITAAVGAGVAIAGGILMGSANKKLKNLRPSSSGIGLAMTF